MNRPDLDNFGLPKVVQTSLFRLQTPLLWELHVWVERIMFGKNYRLARAIMNVQKARDSDSNLAKRAARVTEVIRWRASSGFLC